MAMATQSPPTTTKRKSRTTSVGRGGAGLASLAALLMAGLTLGCGDRSPPAVWPQPEPPSLARPLAGPSEGSQDEASEIREVPVAEDPEADAPVAEAPEAEAPEAEAPVAKAPAGGVPVAEAPREPQ